MDCTSDNERETAAAVALNGTVIYSLAVSITVNNFDAAVSNTTQRFTSYALQCSNALIKLASAVTNAGNLTIDSLLYFCIHTLQKVAIELALQKM